MIGKTVSYFEIVEKLGSGGMGVVYKAHDTLLNRPAALKFLPAHLASDEDAKARFIQEAQAASSLDHTNICAIHQIGETDEGELFIAMAYYEGQTLKYRLKNETFGIDRSMSIGRQLANGRKRAHEAGIVHRDIKPANIMITDRDEVKLLDFGLAKLATGAQLTKSGSTLGTAAYMSPEQFRGEAVGPAADVWSLGVVLYEMLAGHPPFTGDYEQALMYAILNSSPQSISEANPQTPPDVAAFIMQCLEKDPQRRPSMDSLPRTADFGSLVASESRPVVEPSLTSRGDRDPASKRRVALVAGAAFLAIAAVALWFTMSSPTNRDEPAVTTVADSATRIAVLPFTVRGSPDFAYLAEGMVDILSTKLDGAGNWRSVDPRAVLGSLGDAGASIDPAAGSQVAAKVGAHRFILGSIVEVGGSLQVRASVYDPSTGREPVAGGNVSGLAEDLFTLVDELAAQLLVGSDNDPGDRVTRLAAVTTESLPALKSYLEGEAHFRSGRYRQALEAFQAAVRLDSTFALAWYRVSVAAEWNAQGRTATQASRQAIRHSARLAKHDRDLLEAFDLFRQGDATKAEQLYRSIVGVYPEDVEAWFQLGEILAHQAPLMGRSGAGSREAWERVLFFEPDHLQALWHLSRIPALGGNVAEMDSLVNRIIELNPGGDRLVEVLALRAAVHDDEDMKKKALARVATASEGSAALAAHFVAMYSGDPQQGLPFARLMTRPTGSVPQRVLGYMWAAYLEAGGGRVETARSDLSSAVSISEDFALPFAAFAYGLPFLPPDRQKIAATITQLESWDAAAVRKTSSPLSWYAVHDDYYPYLRMYLLGLLSTELGEVDRAKTYARELPGLSVPDALGSVGEDLRLSLRAHIALREGRTEEGLNLLLRQKGHAWYNLMFASPLVSLARDRFVKAELLGDAKRYEEALRWYRSYEENSIYDTVFLAPAHRRQAEIYEELGDLEAAAQHWRKFITMWEGADAELQPLVMEARERLARIETGSL